MKIKDIRLFRQWLTKNARMNDRDPNFIGYSHPYGSDSADPDEKRGLFNVFHSSAPIIENRIATVLDMAQDSQAIYEFVQNAVDCNSTHFYMFYSDNYFVVINNGDVFSLKGIKAILNFAQTTKTEEKDENIGKFGIGFKLIHRMVGEGNSIKELVNDNTGPLLFSWSNRQQLEQMINAKSVDALELSQNTKNWDALDSAWFFKIMLTCAPVLPFSKDYPLRDAHYNSCDSNTNSLFSDKEFSEFTNFLSHVWRQHKSKFDTANLNQGTLFFLKLGKDKESKLNEDYSYFSRGIHYALHFVGMLMNKKGLGTIYVNDHEPIIRENIDLTIEDTFVIPKDSAAFRAIGDKLKGHDRRNDIKLMLGYQPYERNNPKYGELQNTPNFFKFFPMGKEVNQLNFVVHCNVFAIDASRREFVDKHPVNEYVLHWFAKEWAKRLERYKKKDKKRFMNMYLAILSSEDPAKQNPHSQWLSQALYKPLLEYIRNNIPTQNKKVPYGNVGTVRIKDTELDIQPTDFGVNTHHWIYWGLDDLDILQHFSEEEHPNKIGLTAWGVDYLIASSTELHKINKWLTKARPHEFDQFLKELDSHLNKKEAKHALFMQHLKQIKLFKVGNAFYSSRQINQSDDFLVLPDYLDRPEVKGLLGKVGFKFSDISFGQYSTLKEYFLGEISYLQKNSIDLFFRILKKVNIGNSLKKVNKLNLFKVLERIINSSLSPTKDLLRSIPFFRNNQGEYQELRYMLPPDRQNPKWLAEFEIKKEDYSDALLPYLIKSEQVYKTIIYPFWDKIREGFLRAQQGGQAFYRTIRNYYTRRDNKLDVDMISIKSMYLISHYVDGQNTSFRGRNLMYYSTKLDNISHYNALANAIYKTCKLFVPLRGTLSSLKENPFNTISNTESIFRSLPAVCRGLELQEVSALLSYMIDKEKQFFFSIGYVEQDPKNGLYTLCKHTKIRNCDINPKTKLSAYVSKHLSNEYVLLPHDLRSYKNHARQEKEVLERVLEVSKHSKIDDKETLLEIIRLQGNKASLKNFIFDLNKIVINLNKPIDKDTFGVAILLLVHLNFKDKKDLLASVQDKLVFQYKKRIYRVQDFRTSKEIIISRGDKRVQFKVDKLLPHKIAKADQNKAYDLFIQQMVKANLNYRRLNELLELNKTIRSEEIFAELQENYMHKEKALDTAEQLAFLMLYARSNANPVGGEYIGNFYIDTVAGKRAFEASTYYYQHYPFIKKDRLLDKKYESCSKLLSTVYLHPTLDYVLAKSPFIKGDKLHIEEILPTYLFRNQHRKTFLDFLIRLWELNAKAFSSIDWNNIEGNNIGTYLGFDPLQRIVAPKKYLIRSEDCTPMLEDWLGTAAKQGKEVYNKKKSFLQALGFHNEDSTIIRLRRYLSGNTDGIIHTNEGQLKQFLSNNKKYNIFLINTIRWIEQKNIRLRSSDFYIIRLLYQYIDPNEAFTKNSVPLLCITESVNDRTEAELTMYRKNKHHQFYWYDSAQQRLYLQERKISLDKLVNWAINNKISLINLNDYPNNWQKSLSVSINKLEVKEKEPLFSELVKRSEAWAPPYLKLWQKTADAEVRIYKHKGQIPHTITINGKSVWTIYKGDSYMYPFHTQGSSYFINTEIDFESALRDILSSHLYIKLLEAQSRYNQESVLDAAINLHLFVERDEAYEADDWDWEEEKTGVIKDKIFKNGQPISIVLKNTLTGELKLSTEELALLLQSENELFVYDGKQIIRKKLSIINS